MIVIETNSLYAGRIFNDVFNIIVPTNDTLNVVGAKRLFKYKSVEMGKVQIIKVIDGLVISKLLNTESALMLTSHKTTIALQKLEQLHGPKVKYSNICLQYTERNLTNQEELLHGWWTEVKICNQINQPNF